MKINLRLIFITIVFLLCISKTAAASPAQPVELFPSKVLPDYHSLLLHSDAIVAARLDGSYTSWKTGRRVSAVSTLVNSRQHLITHRVLKGTAPTFLLTTGVRPLPRPTDPLNQLYTGPLADGDYLLFLKKYGNGSDSILNGGFSAVYPLYQGRTISLENGFSELGGKSLDEIEEMVH